MANRVPKISSDEATSGSSVDSLSFTSLVCIQEPQKKQRPRAAKQDTEFEFRSVALNSTMVAHQRQAQANVSVSSGHTQHKELLLQSKQLQPASPAHSKVLLREHLGKEKSSYHKDRNKGRENHPRSGSKKEQKTENSDNGSSNTGFGQKLLVSFFSPCRECKTSNPAVKKPNKANKPRSH
ncbi:hypothetical protein MLD38_037051 [Melastoma candidum]|uniref:Uncharacterized protein n=1 Tax=Melastoma candidum TaxID=119954 RepID=A0ACB9LNF6_9MYRT|nr:hypothetical protein MLD38_037051 [Melastoma candidum]